LQSGIRGNRHQGRSGPKHPETFKACQEFTQFFPQREKWPPTASSGSVGSVVSLRPQTIDKYGRTVAEMFRNGQNVNLAMVSSGQAFTYQKYLAACDGFAYLAAEAAAQRQRIGVWAVPGGIQRPWDWRKGPRPPAASTAAPFTPAAGSAPPVAAPAGGYSGRKLTCRQIGSFNRAQELLKQGHTFLDKNGMGWPANRCGEADRVGEPCRSTTFIANLQQKDKDCLNFYGYYYLTCQLIK
jgi:hypothetical protein